jgi:Tfp pilus assembly protein PilP
MRKLVVFTQVIILAASFSCGKKKYNDIREFIDEVVATQREFLSSMEKSANADEAVAAINNFGDKLIRLSEKSVVIKKRHPEIDTWGNQPPDELKKDLAKLDEPESEFEKVFFNKKLKPIFEDEKVKQAFLKLREKMGSVKFF